MARHVIRHPGNVGSSSSTRASSGSPSLSQGALDLGVVRRVAGGGEQHPVQSDASGGMVQLVLVPLALRDFYRHVELHPPSLAHGGPECSPRSPFGAGHHRVERFDDRHSQDGRFRRRIAFAVIALVLLLVGGGIAFAGGLGSSGDTVADETVSVPDAELPELGDAAPVLASLTLAAPAPDPAVLATRIGPLLQAPASAPACPPRSSTSPPARCCSTRTPPSPASPASTAKLLTATAALCTLDPAQTLPTTVVAGTAPGEVVLVGGGDPTLSRTSPSQTYPGAPTVADLAAQVVASLPPGTPVTRVVVDSPLFTGPLTAQGWGPADAPSSYAAPITATAVDGARVSPGSQARSGQPASTPASRRRRPGCAQRHGRPRRGPRGARTLATSTRPPSAGWSSRPCPCRTTCSPRRWPARWRIARDLPASFAGAAEAIVAALGDAASTSPASPSPMAAASPGWTRCPPRAHRRGPRPADGSLAGASAMLSGLPVAGYDGTLSDRGDADHRPRRRARQDRDADGRARPGRYGGHRRGTAAGLRRHRRRVAGSEATAEAALDDVAAALAACGCG